MIDGIAVVLLSGGMDSTVCTAIAKREYSKVAALHLNYGQRTEARELASFQAICKHYGVSQQLVVDVQHLAKIGGSSLTDHSLAVPEADLNSKDIPNSYVPFRNANILAIATSWAEVLEAKALYIGAVQDDSSGYPDCREEFFKAFEALIKAGTRPETNIRIITPIIHRTKQEIVELGRDLAVPFELTWSCYQSSDKPCGHCDSCALRQRGFERAGIQDPLLNQKAEL